VLGIAGQYNDDYQILPRYYSDFMESSVTEPTNDSLFYDGFENYNDFAISSIGNWYMVDYDGGNTWHSTSYDFQNEGYVGSGIIFNPSQTNPSALGSSFDVHSGSKGLFFFASGLGGTTSPNDDWMISPEITLSSLEACSLSFWAKSNTSSYGLERMQIGISNSGTNVNDFNIISEGDYIEIPTTIYTRYSYDLSNYIGQTIRFGIHCVSDDAFVLQTDDFLIKVNSVSPRVMQVQNLDIGGDEDLQHLITHTPAITFGYYDSMNETQTSYQVQVSTQSDYSSADMWDTGEISSSDTSVTYAGATLEDGATYYLRAKVGSGAFYSDWSTLTFRMNSTISMEDLVFDSGLGETSVYTEGFPTVSSSPVDAEGDSVFVYYMLSDNAGFSPLVDSALVYFEPSGADVSWQPTVDPILLII
jgi:hypothetical protein